MAKKLTLPARAESRGTDGNVGGCGEAWLMRRPIGVWLARLPFRSDFAKLCPTTSHGKKARAVPPSNNRGVGTALGSHSLPSSRYTGTITIPSDGLCQSLTFLATRSLVTAEQVGALEPAPPLRLRWTLRHPPRSSRRVLLLLLLLLLSAQPLRRLLPYNMTLG